MVVVVVGEEVIGFGLIVYINPESRASCSFLQVNTVLALPSES